MNRHAASYEIQAEQQKGAPDHERQSQPG